jgi:hypothetical protein
MARRIRNVSAIKHSARHRPLRARAQHFRHQRVWVSGGAVDVDVENRFHIYGVHSCHALMIVGAARQRARRHLSGYSKSEKMLFLKQMLN